MTRGRGYYDPGDDSFGSNSRRNNDYWYVPNDTGNRNGGYGYKNQTHGRNAAGSSNRSRFGEHNKENNNIVCKHYALFNQCRFGAKCSYLHSLKRVINMNDVFRGGVYCSTASITIDNSLELFVCGNGSNVKRFKLFSNSSNEIQTTTLASINIQMPSGHSQLNQASRPRGKGYGSDQSIYSLFFMDDCLFVGLKTGHICVYHIPSSTSTMLEGHESPVNCITVIESIVLSVCESGKVNLWKFDPASGAFTCVNSLILNSRVTCLLEVNCDATTPGAANQPARLLWSGGAVINVIDLASLSIIKTIQLPKNISVKCFMRYGAHVIVGFTNGYIKVFTVVGDEVFITDSEADYITSMDGMQTSEGDVLLVGSRSGHLSVYQLPSFSLQHVLLCHPDGYKRSGISKIYPIGTQHVLTTGYDGNVSVFMWTNLI